EYLHSAHRTERFLRCPGTRSAGVIGPGEWLSSRDWPCSPCHRVGTSHFPPCFRKLPLVLFDRGPRPFWIEDALALCQEVIELLQVGEFTQEQADERHGLIREGERAPSGTRGVKIGMTAQQVVRRAAATRLILLPCQGHQEASFFLGQFHVGPQNLGTRDSSTSE